jgi:hypothetical protein
VSWAPCTNCRRTATGSLRFAYMSIYEASSRIQLRTRLCPACWEGLMGDVLSTAEVRDLEGRWWSVEERAGETLLGVAQSK